MAGWHHSAWGCLALVVAAVFASEEPRSPGGSPPEPVSSVVVASSSTAAGTAGENSKNVYEQPELNRSDPEDDRRAGAGICDRGTQTSAVIAIALYCAVQQAPQRVMSEYLLSATAFWICLPLAICKSTIWYRLPLSIDLKWFGHTGVFFEAVVAANMAFNGDQLLPTWMLSFRPIGWLSLHPIELATCFCMFLASCRFLCLALPPSPSHVASRGRRTSDGLVRFGGDNQYIVSNVYKDLTHELFYVFMIFVVQAAAILFYYLHLNVIFYRTKEGVSPSFIKWALGVCVIGCKGVDEMGASFDVRYWTMVVRTLDNTRGVKTMKRVEVQVRRFMAFFVNGIGLTLIRGTFPIILAKSTHWQFITDCMAVFFVTSLDDIKTDRVFDVHHDIVPLVGETNDDCDSKEDASTSGLSDTQTTEDAEVAQVFASFVET